MSDVAEARTRTPKAAPSPAPARAPSPAPSGDTSYRDKPPPAPDAAPDTTPDDAQDAAPRQADHPSQPKPSPFKRPAVRIALIVAAALALAGIGVWAFNWWTHGRFIESTNDAYLKADQVAVSTRIAGTVQQVLVADNVGVTAGEALVQLDDRDARARLRQAHAQADQARASITQSQAQISQQHAQIERSQANLAGARAQARFAGRQTARYAALSASGAESTEHYDQMRQNRDQSAAQVEAGAAEVLAAQRQINAYQAQIEQAKAQIEQADAAAQQAQVDLDATLVRASISGRVGDRTVRVGQFVQPGTRMMTVVPLQDIYVLANFKENQFGSMRVGQPAKISVDALSGKPLHGTIESFAPGTGSDFALIPPENATGNFTKIVQRVPVRVRIDADTAQRRVLVPGLSVTVAVDTKRADATRQGADTTPAGDEPADPRGTDQ